MTKLESKIVKQAEKATETGKYTQKMNNCETKAAKRYCKNTQFKLQYNKHEATAL